MRKQVLFIFFLFILAHQAHAQYGHRLGVGYGLGHLSWKDQAVSPILYSGYTSGGLYFHHSIIKETSFTKWTYTRYSGELHPSSVVLQPSLIMSSYHKLEASRHRMLYAMGPNRPTLFWAAYAKGQHTHHHHTEFRNSRNQRYYVGYLGVGLSVQHHLLLSGKETLFSAGFNIPLMGFAVRNSFSYPHPTPWISNENQGFFTPLKGGNLYGPLGYSGFDFHGTMEFPLGKGWGVSAYYNWDIHYLADVNELQESAHQFIFGISYLLNHRKQ